MLKEIFIAIQAYGKAHGFIKKHKLWKWILIPGIIYMLLFVASMYLFWHSFNQFVDWVTNASGIRAWLNGMDNGFLSFLFAFSGLVLSLAAMMFYFSFFKFIWLIVGSPVFSYLSEKTEAIIEGKDFPFSLPQLLKDIARGIRLAARNLLWQSVYALAILILSLVPLAGWAAPLIALLVECYYYGFSMLDYSMERHRKSAAESIYYVGQHKGLAVGNGAVFYIMHFIPIIGWVLAPAYAVIAATLSLYPLKEPNK